MLLALDIGDSIFRIWHIEHFFFILEEGVVQDIPSHSAVLEDEQCCACECKCHILVG
jgi:hypothetical protein